MSNTKTATLIFEDLTIGEIIALLDNGDGHSLCSGWHRFLPFKSDLRGAWDALVGDDLDTFCEHLNLDFSVPTAFINAVKPFILSSRHDELEEHLKESFDDDWLVKDDDKRFEQFKTLIFDKIKEILSTGDAKVNLVHKKKS